MKIRTIAGTLLAATLLTATAPAAMAKTEKSPEGTFLVKAEKAFDDHHYLLALDQSRRELDAHPKNAKAALLAMQSAFNIDDLWSTVKYAELAIKNGEKGNLTDFEMQMTYVYMIVAQNLMGDSKATEKWIKNAEKRYPDSEIIHSAIGSVHKENGNNAGADKSYMHTLRINPANEEAMDYLFGRLCDTDNYALMSTLCDKAIAENPKNPGFYLYRSVVRIATDNIEGMAEDLLTAGDLAGYDTSKLEYLMDNDIPQEMKDAIDTAIGRRIRAAGGDEKADPRLLSLEAHYRYAWGDMFVPYYLLTIVTDTDKATADDYLVKALIQDSFKEHEKAYLTVEKALTLFPDHEKLRELHTSLEEKLRNQNLELRVDTSDDVWRLDNLNSNSIEELVAKMNAQCPVKMGMAGILTSVKYDSKRKKLIATMDSNSFEAVAGMVNNPRRKKSRIRKLADSFVKDTPALTDLGISVEYVYNFRDGKQPITLSITSADLRDAKRNPLSQREIDQMGLEDLIAIEKDTSPESTVYVKDGYLIIDLPTDSGVTSPSLIELQREQITKNLETILCDIGVRSAYKPLHNLGMGLMYRFIFPDSETPVIFRFTPERLRQLWNGQ